MTQEEKELLLKDLSARSLNKPKVKVLSFWNEDKGVEEDIVDSVYCVMPDGYINTETINSDISLDNIVLYLRPMSSMTDEEKVEIQDLYHQNTQEVFKDPSEIRGYRFYDISVVDWLNAHHFDYRGLIPMGLALEAPEGMYK